MDETVAYNVTNHPTAQVLAEMVLWSPRQGSYKELIPIELDVSFGCEVVETPNTILTVRTTRANLHATMKGSEIARGTKYGDHLNAPYEVAEIIETGKSLIESEGETAGNAEFTLLPGALGNLSLLFRRRKRKFRKKETDNVVRIARQIHRVVARTGNTWLFVEPRAPRVLDGKYLGETVQTLSGEKSDPLFLATVQTIPAVIDLFLATSVRDLVIDARLRSGAETITSNKRVVVSQLVKRAVIVDGVDVPTLPMNKSVSDDIILCASRLEVGHEN